MTEKKDYPYSAMSSQYNHEYSAELTPNTEEHITQFTGNSWEKFAAPCFCRQPSNFPISSVKHFLIVYSISQVFIPE